MVLICSENGAREVVPIRKAALWVPGLQGGVDRALVVALVGVALSSVGDRLFDDLLDDWFVGLSDDWLVGLRDNGLVGLLDDRLVALRNYGLVGLSKDGLDAPFDDRSIETLDLSGDGLVCLFDDRLVRLLDDGLICLLDDGLVCLLHDRHVVFPIGRLVDFDFLDDRLLVDLDFLLDGLLIDLLDLHKLGFSSGSLLGFKSQREGAAAVAGLLLDFEHRLVFILALLLNLFRLNFHFIFRFNFDRLLYDNDGLLFTKDRFLRDGLTVTVAAYKMVACVRQTR